MPEAEKLRVQGWGSVWINKDFHNEVPYKLCEIRRDFATFIVV